MKILLIDNEKRFRLTAKKLLSRKGYEVLIASKWSEALQRLEHYIIHVVILGVNLPDMKSMEALKQIKRRFQLVQVIILSGTRTLGSVANGLELGAIDFLIKPADAEELLKKTAEAVKKRQRLEQKIRAIQIDVLERQFGCSD